MYRLNKSITEYIAAIRFALGNLTLNKGRAFLSVLGVVIGVIAVIVVVGAGQAVKQFVISQIESFGTDIVQVETRQPQTGKNVSREGQSATNTSINFPTTFKLKDAEELSEFSNVNNWYAAIIGQEVFSYQEKNQSIIIFGTTGNVMQVDKQTKVAEGRLYTEGEDDGLAQVVVLGSKLKEDLFGQQEALGKTVKIRGNSYKVIGVLQERGSVAFFDFDKLAYMPLQTLQKKIMGIDYIQMASFKVEDKRKLEDTMVNMRFKMRELHDIEDAVEDDFIVSSVEEASEIIGNVFKYINWLLIALTAISLLVGGVNIMNVMYVAVAERTFEIGLRKAIGASEANIRHQFLFESIVISLVGAIVGIILGILFMYVLSLIAAKFNYTVESFVSLQAILIALTFSLVAGIIFGYYPARKASKLTPVEALRK